MDRDLLAQEIQKLLKWLNEHEATEENYAIVEDRLIKLAKLCIELDDSCDKQNDRQNKADLEKYKMDQEFELKLKEIELKYHLENSKVENDSKEYAARRRAEKRQAWWDLIKIGLQVGGSAALIIITGNLEQNVIIGQHKWSLIPKIKT